MSKGNEQFYKNCTKYFEFLRKKGKIDYNFEDEYYFTMPAISNQQMYVEMILQLDQLPIVEKRIPCNQ